MHSNPIAAGRSRSVRADSYHADMTTTRFIHTADWQLGMSRRFLGSEAQAVFNHDRLAAVRALGPLAREHGAEFVVVAGDVFDDNAVERPHVLRALTELGTIGVDVYLLPGNHDPLDAASVYLSRDFVERKPRNVHVVADHEPIRVADGVELVGVPWLSKRTDPLRLSALLESLEPTVGHRVLLAHGGTDEVFGGYSPSTESLRIADLEAAVTSGAVDYIALGDRHSVTSAGSTGRIWYSGTPEVTDFDDVESDSGSVLLVSLDSDTCEVEPLGVGGWSFKAINETIDAEADLDALVAYLDGLPDKSRTVLKIGLVGTVGIELKARIDDHLQRWSETFASAFLRDSRTDLAVQPDDVDFTEWVSGYAGAAVDDLVARVAAGGDEAVDAGNALSLLYRLSAGGAR